MTTSMPLTLPAAPDLIAALEKWHDYLVVLRKTSAGAASDVHSFIRFYPATTVRRWVYARSATHPSPISAPGYRQTSDKRGTASRARTYRVSKNFLKFLDKNGYLHNAAVRLIQSPKLPHKLPRALSADQSLGLVANADAMTDDWTGLRDRAFSPIRLWPADQRGIGA